MGWHHHDGDFSRYTDLWALRKQLGDSCNVMHKYPNDSDFFIAIGDLTNLDALTDPELSELKAAASEVERACATLGLKEASGMTLKRSGKREAEAELFVSLR